MAIIESIVAASTRVLGGKGRGGGGNKSSGRASIAWDMWECVPEVGTYADWVSNAMSGAQLIAGRRGADGDVIPLPPTSRASQLVASIAGGVDGQSVLLGDFGTQLAVTGDSWVVIIPKKDSDTYAEDRWEVLSTEEVKVQRGKIIATIDEEPFEIPEYDPDAPHDPDAPVAFRVWKSSGRRKAQATSPVIRSLVVLEELRLLNAAVAAIAKSRITGRGLLLIPAGTRFPAQPGQDGAEDSLLDTLIEVMSTAIREPDSAAATTPITLEVPSDLISGVKWIEFASEFDTVAIQLRDEAIRRFAIGADVPAEVLLGLGDSNHWGAWALTAEALRMGAEPRLALVCQALTNEWLRPLLELDGEPDFEQLMVWYDTAGLRTASNKAASALEAYKEGLISGKAARREMGFAETDAPGTADTMARVNDATTDERDLPVNETQSPPAAPDMNDVPVSLAASGAVLDSFTAGTNAALAEAVDGLVWSALVVAGRKIINTPLCARPFRRAALDMAAFGTVHTHHSPSAEEVASYRLLDGAWTRVPDVAARFGMDAADLADGLDGYVTGLLITGSKHEFSHVPRLLAQLKLAGLAVAS